MGKFSQPRNRRAEEREMEETFRRLTNQPEELPEEPEPSRPTKGKYVATTPGKHTASSQPKKNMALLISLCSAAAIVLIGIIITVVVMFGNFGDDGLILPNVTVGGVNVGGMTRKEAETALRRATELTYTKEDMVIQLPDGDLLLTPANTGAKLNVEAAIDAAYDYGRTGTKEEREQARLKAQTEPHVIALLPYLELNTDYIRQVIDEFGASYISTYIDTSISLEGDAPALSGEDFDPEAPCQTLVITIGTPGRSLDTDLLYNMVLDAYSFNTFVVVAELEPPEGEPDIPNADDLYEEYYSAPQDASMDDETFEVTPEVYGYGFNLPYAKRLLENASYGDVLEIPMEYIEPGVVQDGLSDVLYRDVLAEYATPHTNNAARNNNLELSCAAVNGLILYPGDVFDYNVVVGKRTAERGYQAADAYSGGETVKELGGGICQVSSTLYY